MTVPWIADSLQFAIKQSMGQSQRVTTTIAHKMNIQNLKKKKKLNRTNISN